MSVRDWKLKWIWAVVLVGAGLAAGLVVSSKLDLTGLGGAVTQPAFKSNPALTQMSESLGDVAEAVIPSVVNISTTKMVKQENPLYPFYSDPFFRKFFGEPDEGQGGGRYREFKERSLGSGVIVSNDGYIVTNNHVVEGADDIKVVLSDKREFKGKVVGADSRSDIAVVKISAKDLPALGWANSDKLRPGEMVMAVGAPFGLTQTVTTGIISAVGRVNVGITDYEDFIQTDAAINPGNSGGALVNMKAEIVGINTAIFSRTGGYQGVGFAVPSNMARKVMESLVKTGKVVRGWLGVSVQDLTPQLARQFGAKENEGALVGEVMKDSPAEKAGLKRGDVIVAVSGSRVQDAGHLRNLVAGMAVGAKVKLDVIRDKKEVHIEAVVGELPKEVQAKEGGESPEGPTALAGVAVQDLTPEMAGKLDLDKDTRGVVVMSVEQGSAADEAGLQRGDVIMSINREPVKNLKGYNGIISKLGKGEPVLLLINRQGSALWMSISSAD